MSFDPATPVSFGDCTACPPCSACTIKVWWVSGSDQTNICTGNQSALIAAVDAAVATPPWSSIPDGELGYQGYYSHVGCSDALTFGPNYDTGPASYIGAGTGPFYNENDPAAPGFNYSKALLQVTGPCDEFCLQWCVGSSGYVSCDGSIVYTTYGPVASGATLVITPAFTGGWTYVVDMAAGDCTGDP
jgi:hypothetical protein